MLATAATAATAGTASAATTRTGADASNDGTPEQIHLTWGNDPARSVVVSWASPGQATRPRVLIGERVILAEERSYTDGVNGETAYTYHTRIQNLGPGKTYAYVVTADNDASAADPFSATFTTAPEGRAKFRFTSFGDLATPNTAWVLSYGQSAYAVDAVESFQPLFHLLNGDLCYANLNPIEPARGLAGLRQQQPALGRQPALDALPRQPRDRVRQRPAGPRLLPDPVHAARPTACRGSTGRWYSFRWAPCCSCPSAPTTWSTRTRRAFVAGPAALVPAASTGNAPIEPGTSLYVEGYSGGAQTRWLRATPCARAAGPVDRLDHRPDAPVALARRP